MSAVVVVGGGVAGLATAALAAERGHDVTVLEAHEQFGGRARVWRSEGFTFDTGPSWWLMPEVFDRFYDAVGATAAERPELAPLSPGYRIFGGPGEPTLDVDADPAARRALWERLEPGSADRLERYLAGSSEAYDLALKHFLYTDFRNLGGLATALGPRGLARLAGLMTTSLDRFAKRSFRERRQLDILRYPAIFLGTSSTDAPALYSLMSHLDLVQGVQYPVGGFGGFVDGLVAIAERHGATLLPSTRVTRIVTEAAGRRRRATGVEVRTADGGTRTLPADVVVSAADLQHTETALLDAPSRSWRDGHWRRVRPGMSAVLACVGVDRPLPELVHHNFVFSADWERNMSAVFDDERRAAAASAGLADASAYLCRPSATDPDVAPPGGEALFLLAPVRADPSIGRGGIDGAGDAAVERIADDALARIGAAAGVGDLGARTVTRRTFGPGDFLDDYATPFGSLLGPDHRVTQSGPFRGRVRSRRVSNLRYAGSSTRPGVGLPMTIISAHVAVDALED